VVPPGGSAHILQNAYLINMSLATSAPGLHQLLACDLVQNLVYLVQLHHCTKARYAYA